MCVVGTVLLVLVIAGLLLFMLGDPPRGHRPRPSSTPLDRPAPPPGPGSTSRAQEEITMTVLVDHPADTSAPTVTTVDLMLAQLERDRAQSSYWSSPERADQLNSAEVWLLSLRDWLESGRGARVDQ